MPGNIPQIRPRPHKSSSSPLTVSLCAVPIAVAAPAALAGLAYLNAKTQLSYDYRLLTAFFNAIIRGKLRESKGRLNVFYILEEQAAKYPETVLLIFEGRQWTYKEVYEISIKCGTWLKNTYNIQPKEIVAIDFENSEKFIFVWFGLWAIGAKPAFINYNLTGKALAHCIRVSTARLVLIDPRVAHHFNDIPEDDLEYIKGVEQVIFTPELETSVMFVKGVREPDEVREENELKDMAMLIYTSGTTGLPKPAHVSWAKCIIGGRLVPRWMSFGRPDVFYTVSTLHLVSSPRSLMSHSACLSITLQLPSWVFSPPCQSAPLVPWVGNFPTKPSGPKSAPQKQP
jgi:acyl-coenzyme A synthetase/AMP-(fatty) acid ligase